MRVNVNKRRNEWLTGAGLVKIDYTMPNEIHNSHVHAFRFFSQIKVTIVKLDLRFPVQNRVTQAIQCLQYLFTDIFLSFRGLSIISKFPLPLWTHSYVV